ncbi:MAG: hypothetical protein HYR90_04495 [Candidatus Andersenbacteria bacterium]|nr:hypothetical protein [Candidatus Andersenbacteria bacterium]MBI3250468.1 hypothetical protein [Candidatus Andersenbacteria bacterium]
MLSLLRWHILDAPTFLLTLAWNIQRVLLRLFSVPLMLRTLVSHWHKDVVSYERAGLSKLALAFAWNMISRVIGFVVRTFTLATYSIAALLVLVASILTVIVFIAWPVVGALGLFVSIQTLF